MLGADTHRQNNKDRGKPFVRQGHPQGRTTKTERRHMLGRAQHTAEQ